MGLFDFLRRWKRETVPAAVAEWDDRGVTCRGPNGLTESVTWDDLRTVLIRTTSDGPFADDVFWFLMGSEGECVVPSEARGAAGLLERLQQLPGFNDEALIQAMSCPDDAKFVCWERKDAAQGTAEQE